MRSWEESDWRSGDADAGPSSTTRRRLMRYAAATAVVGGFAGCSGSRSESTATETSDGVGASSSSVSVGEIPTGGTFIDGTTTDSRALNVLRLGDGATTDRVFQVFDPGFDRAGPEYENVEPLLFESVTFADDLTSLEVTLRPNLEFGGGYGAVTADDYLWTIENVWRADWFPFTYSYLFNVGEDEKPIRFERVDEYTIREVLPEPRPFFPYNEPLGGLVPIPRGLAEEYVANQDKEGLLQDEAIVEAQFNGNLGPWDLERYTEQSAFVFTAADDYYLRRWAEEDDAVPDEYARAPFFDRYKIQIFENDAAARQALEAGEIDRYDVSATKVPAFESAEDVELYENRYVAYSDYLGLNHRANGWDPIRNRKVRYAFANLYDRTFVVENILEGRGTPQATLYPQWGPYYPEDTPSFEGTVERARQLLREGTPSGYGYSGDAFVGPDGEQVELTLVYVSGTLDDLRAAYTKKRFEKAGFAITQETTSWTSMLKNYFYTKTPAEGVADDANIGYGPDGTAHPSVYNYGPPDRAVSSKDWDLMLTLGFSYGPLDPAGTVANLFGEEQNFNAYGYTPPESLTAMRDEAKTAVSRDAAEDTIRRMLGLLARDLPVVFESNYYSYVGYNDRVRNLPESPARNYFVDQNHDVMYFSDGRSGR